MKQKLTAVMLIFALTAAGCSVGQGDADSEDPDTDPADYTSYEQIFAGDRVIDVSVTIEEEDWQSILESPLDKDYKSVSVVFDGIELENVGFSTKGNSTLRSVAASSESERYSFRLKFDKFDKEQTLLGLDKFSMNNNMTDASYLREYLHYEALRSTGLPTPMTTFVNLYINGELYGLYTGVENEDDSFLQRNFGDDYDSGVFYDTEEGARLTVDESGEYSAWTFETGTDDEKASLIRMIEALNSMPEGEKGDIESVLHVDSALSYIAANTVFGNYDSYNGRMAHNYKLYGDADGYFTVIPWDFNMSFDGFSMGGGNAAEVSIKEPILGTTMDRVPLIQNLLAVEEYFERYLDYIRLYTDYLESAEERAIELADLIRPHVEADPTKFYTMEEFETSLIYNENEERSGFGGVPGFSENGERPEGMNGEMPDFDGVRPDFEGEIPDFDRNSPGFGGNRPDFNGEMPDFNGEIPDRDVDFSPPGDDSGGPGEGRPGGGPGGDGMMNASGSLVTFIRNRLEHLRTQLASWD